MNADHDDLPYYLQRTTNKANPWRWIVAVVIGSAVSLGLLFLAGQSFEQPLQAAAPTPALIPIQHNPPTAVIDARISAPVAAPAAPAQAAKAPKQTVFNDQNYQPKALVNSVARPPVSTNEQTGSIAAGVVTGVSEKPTACWPFKEGSIEYRDCKRAVQLNARNR